MVYWSIHTFEPTLANLVTINSLDGNYQAKEGGIVKAYTLTGTTELTKLTNDYNSSGVVLNNFISNNVDAVFTKGYPANEEYLFFLNRLCTNNITKFQNYITLCLCFSVLLSVCLSV